LSRADISHLPNGLTLIVLEDHSFPLVSVQALYKSGSRDESAGKTGLAHFLEHLAFRASRDFPNAGATEAVYDHGGEWHGYTWLDQTTYFATAPKGDLDLLLRIEADRMANVTIDPSAIAAEKGAVITEMHSYENDPQSVLFDAVAATALQAHPYRIPTIGYETDVAALTAGDARAFYRRHYTPANAVLAIAGDVDTATAKAAVSRRFAALPALPATQRIKAIEPPQQGERRTEIRGPVDRQYFSIAYPAPAASNPDFAAFLVLQQLAGGGSGVNFRQNDWGEPVRAGSALANLSGDLATWFAPSADAHLFLIKGSIDANGNPAAVERAIATRLRSLAGGSLTASRLEAAKAAVTRELAADLETTEDAAHQLAYFEGIGALDTLLHLEQRVADVTNADIRRVEAAFLDPRRRTVGWYLPGPARSSDPLGASSPRESANIGGSPAPATAAPQPLLMHLRSGLPVIVQRSELSDRVTVQVLMNVPIEGERTAPQLAGLGLITRSGSSGDLPALIAEARKALAKPPAAALAKSADPEQALGRMMEVHMLAARQGSTRPILAVVSGNVDAVRAQALLEGVLGRVEYAAIDRRSFRAPTAVLNAPTRVALPGAFSQGALGYMAAGPPPGTRDALAWRILLYILAHDYSGRLGRSAIGDKGLAYYLDDQLRTDGARTWVTVSAGVDPPRADALTEEFRAQLARLETEPPIDAEIEAAKRHILGRDLTAAQSNEELVDKLTAEFVETGEPQSHASLEARLRSVRSEDVLRNLAPFTHGTLFRVDVAAR
jgi:zinc protease